MKRSIFIVITTIILLISMTFPITVLAESMPTTTIISVKAQNKAFTVKWKKKSNITGYQIQYSTNSKFKKGNKSIKIKNAKTRSKKITKLKSNKKYYVRIRTYKGKKYSKWSKVKSAKISKESKSNKDNIHKEMHCTNNNNHGMSCGDAGIWVASKNEFKTYYENYCEKWNSKWVNDEISSGEYYQNCPYGYECWSCSYCGKWTGNFKYR